MRHLRYALTLLGLMAGGWAFGQSEIPSQVAVPVASQPPLNPPVPSTAVPAPDGPAVDTAAIFGIYKEGWDQLSNNQLIRLLWVAWKYEWPRDSLVAVVHRHPQGYSRDSMIVWLEEGGKAGEERKRIAQIKARRYQIATEAFNYTGDVRQLDLSLMWYGVMANDDGRWTLGNVKPKVLLSQFQSQPGALEFDIQTNRAQGCHFLFGSPVPLDTVRNWYGGALSYVNDMPTLLPGTAEIMDRPNGSWMYVLLATGAVTGPGKCGGLKDYELQIRNQKTDQEIALSQNIGAQLVDSVYTCVPELYWSGYLMDDDVPDALFVQEIPRGLRMVLFLSDPAPEGQIWIKSAEWFLYNEESEPTEGEDAPSS
ncbi:MAG: hypothetical protein RL168_776 [Bacteroidota bacterium]